MRGEIKRQLGQGFRLFRRPTVDADDLQPLVRRFYRGRGFRPAWTSGRGPTADARLLRRALDQAPREGLDPSTYALGRIDSLMKRATPRFLGPRTPTRSLAALDLLLTRAFLGFAAHLSTGQVDPRALPADWHVRRRRVNLVAILSDSLHAHHVPEALAAMPPRDPRYAALGGALERYRAIAAAGGWSPIPPGPTLRRGQHGPRVVALRARLARAGDLPPQGSRSAVFDGETEAALRRVQERLGLTPDGVAKAQDLAALNVPVERRVRQIELNMERWRWVPDSLGDSYLMVNIPAFALELYEQGKPALTSRVVVGKQFSPTPMFSDRITYLVINPSWYLPASIIAREVLPAMMQDRSYLKRTGIRVFDSPHPDAREVDPARVNWSSLDWDTSSTQPFPYSFRQEPGPQNPVGHVKFMCPNQFDVYLHDTPAGHLFSQSERDFSHGCVRVEHAVELAERLLEGVPGWSRAELLAAFASSMRDSAVRLPQPMPVHLFYWTAWVDDRGRVQFRDDVYGLDRVLEEALGHRRPL